MEERIIVTQPKGFKNEKYLDYVCHLQKSLYGLRQTPRMWYRCLKDFLIKIDFKESYSDSSFIHFLGSEIVYLLICLYWQHSINKSSKKLIQDNNHSIIGRSYRKRFGWFKVLFGNSCKEEKEHLYNIQYLINFLESCDFGNLKSSPKPMLLQLDLVW